ncbi:Autophagy-related protein 9A [Halotydeus destructor]|nr:Autophagy-related protein 9A [Halotydeus destructor]
MLYALKARWKFQDDLNVANVGDLEGFLSLVYDYHRYKGGYNIVLRNASKYYGFLWLYSYINLLVYGVDYDILFKYKLPSHGGEATFFDIFKNSAKVPPPGYLIVLPVCIALAVIQLDSLRLVQMVRQFYSAILKIEDSSEYYWEEIECRLIQKKHKFLRPDMTPAENFTAQEMSTEAIAEKLRRRARGHGYVNLLVIPFMQLWHLYAVLIVCLRSVKENFSGFFKLRKWTREAKLHFRLQDELDHELKQRLDLCYKPAVRYCQSLKSATIDFLATTVSSIAAFLLFFMALSSLLDKDVVGIKYFVSVTMFLTLVFMFFRQFILDEIPLEFTRKTLYDNICDLLKTTPPHPSHSPKAKKYIQHYFRARWISVVEELFSPVVTTYLLIVIIPRNAENIVDFLREYNNLRSNQPNHDV